MYIIVKQQIMFMARFVISYYFKVRKVCLYRNIQWLNIKT